jgi:hypothetical protein
MQDPYRFELHGKAFEGGDRVDKLAAGLSGLQHIFDGNYRALTGKKRISESDRDRYQVRVTQYRQGSFIAGLGAVYSGLQAVLPLTSDPQQIWELTKGGFDFLKLVYDLAHAGKQPTVQQTGDGNVTVIAGDTYNTYNGTVYQVGTQIIGGVRELDNLLGVPEVSRIALLGPRNDPVFELNAAEKGRFFPPTSIDESPVLLVCDIFDFNKYENMGRARVAPEQAVLPGNYRFKNIGDQSVEDFILSMTEKQVKLHCLVKYVYDPLSDSKIDELLVIKVAA